MAQTFDSLTSALTAASFHRPTAPDLDRAFFAAREPATPEKKAPPARPRLLPTGVASPEEAIRVAPGRRLELVPETEPPVAFRDERDLAAEALGEERDLMAEAFLNEAEVTRAESRAHARRRTVRRVISTLLAGVAVSALVAGARVAIDAASGPDAIEAAAR